MYGPTPNFLLINGYAVALPRHHLEIANSFFVFIDTDIGMNFSNSLKMLAFVCYLLIKSQYLMYTAVFIIPSFSQLSFIILVGNTLQLFLKLFSRSELIPCVVKRVYVYNVNSWLDMIWASFVLNLVENILGCYHGITINLDFSYFISALFKRLLYLALLF